MLHLCIEVHPQRHGLAVLDNLWQTSSEDISAPGLKCVHGDAQVIRGLKWLKMSQSRWFTHWLTSETNWQCGSNSMKLELDPALDMKQRVASTPNYVLYLHFTARPSVQQRAILAAKSTSKYYNLQSIGIPHVMFAPCHSIEQQVPSIWDQTTDNLHNISQLCLFPVRCTWLYTNKTYKKTVPVDHCGVSKKWLWSTSL